MSNKTYYTITSVFFLIIGLAHAARVLMGWPAVIGDFEVPLWMSGIAAIMTLYLAARGFGAVGKKRAR
ncbi:MAG TPA: hypothetical protein VGP13_00980 [Candidatus Paceibacterota bacterium]|jgi:hypothetical protein|nr:hypothetical protein [Candidatus Paceibacterota bacterium]